MRKDTRSTRFQRSPFIRRATSAEGTRMTRLRQANQLGSLSRQRKHLLAERAHHHHRDVADADRLADDLARGKERGPGLGAEQRDRAALGALLGGERPPALDAVPVERKVVAVDAAHLAILVGIGRADPAAGDFLLRRPLDGPGVEELRLFAVLAPEAEVRRFERRRGAVLDGRRLLHHQAVHAPELRPALVGSPALAVGDREPAEDRRHARARRRSPAGSSGRGSPGSRPRPR